MPLTTFHQGLHCWLRHRDGLQGMRYNIIYLFIYYYYYYYYYYYFYYYYFFFFGGGGGGGGITFDPLVYT